MSDLVKKILAVLVIFIIVIGGVLAVKGIGPIDPLKDQIKLGLDIEGGVYVVMEAQTDLTGDEERPDDSTEIGYMADSG